MKDYAELHGRQREKLSEVTRGRCKNKKLRKRLEADPPAWLAWYFSEAYALEFGKVHLDMIERGLYAIEHGGKTVTAAPRGTGKSAIHWGLALYRLATRRGEFPAIVPWEARAVRRALRFWKNALCSNERFAADYPELCAPFVKCKQNSQRLVSLIWKDTKKNTGARLLVSEGLIILPDSRGVLGSTTINGNPRGLNHSTEDGKILRPTLVIIDDPQDREAANSPSQVQSIISQIDSDVLGMGGPGRKVAALMACTIIRKHDAASHYLSNPQWDAARIPLITAWPTNRKLWDKWNEVRITGEDQKDGGAAARKFYRQNKADLLHGFEVSWHERFDRERKQPDAYFAAMWDFYEMGEAAFMAEMQNDPPSDVGTQYRLTVEIVTSHTMPLARLQLPASAGIFTAMIDINRIGLHWAAAGFDQLMTSHVSAYGRWPANGGELWAKNAPELQRKQAIFAGVKSLCDALAATTFRRDGKRTLPRLVLIDRGFEPDVVHKFCTAAAYPFTVFPSRGYAAHKYSPIKSMLVGKPMEGCHVSTSTMGQFVAFNADMWRETAQRAFLSDPGSPGGCTLYEPNRETEHVTFAEHLSAEWIANKYETERGPRWEWTHAVGANWDYGDALTGCYVAAAVLGLSASGIQVQERPRRSRNAGGVIVVNL